MLLGTLGARLLGNMLPCKGLIKAGYRLILELILKYKSITKMNLDLVVFILEIIHLRKQRMGHVKQILISVLILELIGLLFMHWKIMLNNFEMFGIEYKSKILLMNLQLCKKILEYKHMIQQWADIFVLNLLILCVEVKT